MNACDTNKLPRSIQLDDPKKAKKIHWVQDMDQKAKQRMNSRIKVIQQKIKNPNYDPELFETCQNMVREKALRTEYLRQMQYEMDFGIVSEDGEQNQNTLS